MIRRPPRSTLFPYTTLFRSRLAKSPLSPQLFACQRQRIAEGRDLLVVPGCLPDAGQKTYPLGVSEESDQRKHSQQNGGGPPYGHLRPLPPCLEAEVPTHLLKGNFHAPPPHEPGNDLLRIATKIGA